jgi:hypothetical protein
VSVVRALVVVDSMFGNTYQVGVSVKEGLCEVHPSVQARVLRASDVHSGDVAGVDLLVVGTPTHWRGVPSQRTHHQYLRDADEAAGVTRIGTPIDRAASGMRVRDWIGTLPHVDSGRAATFDTRLARPLAGGAAPRLARRLARLGYTLTGEPAGFFVTGMEGPLRSGELDRAADWGYRLLAPLLAT